MHKAALLLCIVLVINGQLGQARPQSQEGATAGGDEGNQPVRDSQPAGGQGGGDQSGSQPAQGDQVASGGGDQAEKEGEWYPMGRASERNMHDYLINQV